MLMLQFLWFWDDLRHPGSQHAAACCWPMGCSSWWMLGYGNWQLATAGGELVSMLSGFITPCDCVQATSHITGKVPTDFVTTMCQNCYRIPETFSPSNSCSCCFITIYYLNLFNLFNHHFKSVGNISQPVTPLRKVLDEICHLYSPRLTWRRFSRGTHVSHGFWQRLGDWGD